MCPIAGEPAAAWFEQAGVTLIAPRRASGTARTQGVRCDIKNDRFRRDLVVRREFDEGLQSTLCGTRRALEVVRALPFKLGRVRRIGGSATIRVPATG